MKRTIVPGAGAQLLHLGASCDHGLECVARCVSLADQLFLPLLFLGLSVYPLVETDDGA